MYMQIKNLEWPKNSLSQESPREIAAFELLERIFVRDPGMRPSVKEVLDDEYFRELGAGELLVVPLSLNEMNESLE
jgi:serine/threonine protein kinase